MMKRHYYTYFDRNYLVKGMALIESIQRHEKTDYEFFAICADELTRIMLNKFKYENVHIVPLHDVENGDIYLIKAKQNRSLTEYYWSLKATIALYILKHESEIDTLTYLDADLFFYSSPDPIFEEFGEHSVLIHEHRFSPEQRFLEKYGKYNAGFLSFRNDINGVETLKWWRGKCLEWCYARLENGKYGDQLYLDDWPSRFRDVVVLQNVGAGVGPWNHIQYGFSKDSRDYQVLVNNIPLVFYHFHSLAFVGTQVVIPSKYVTNPFTKDILRLCFVPYLNTLSKLIDNVRAVLPDFDFGIKHETVIDYRHVFLARGEMRTQLEKSAITQFKISLDKNWDCYCSEQLREFSTHIDKINGLIETGETAVALSSVKNAMTEFPEAPPLLALQADLEYEGEKRRNALERVIESYPNCGRAHSSLGLLYHNGGTKEKALYHYEKAAGLEPQNIIYQKALADVYYTALGRTEDAMQLYLRIFTINPDDIENLLMLGHTCLSLEKSDKAKIFYKRVMDLEPWNMDARERLDGLGAEDGSRESEVGGQVSGFRKDEPRRADFSETAERMYRGAQELIKRGRKRDGVDELEKLVGSFSDYALAHNDLGALYFDEGDKEKALQHYQKAAALESHNPIFQKTLADFYYVVLGQVEDALEHYAKALSSTPEDIETLLMLGHISVSRRKFEEAKIFYNNVLEIEPWNKDAREKLGLLEKREKADDEDETALND